MTVGSGGKADDAKTESTVYDVEHGEYVLEIAVRPDQTALDVWVDDWQFTLAWDGMTARCPCRTFASSVLTIEVNELADELGIEVIDARLGLEARVEERDGEFFVVVADGEPTVGDYLALLESADDSERALLDRIAETDLEAYLRPRNPRGELRLFWDDAEELAMVADALNRRVYQPPAL